MLLGMYKGRWLNGNFLISYVVDSAHLVDDRIYPWDIEPVVKDTPNRVSVWDYETAVQLYKDRPDLVEHMVNDLERRFGRSLWPTHRLAYRVTRDLSSCNKLLILQLTRDWAHQVPSWAMWAIRTRYLTRREWRKWLRSIPEKYKEQR